MFQYFKLYYFHFPISFNNFTLSFMIIKSSNFSGSSLDLIGVRIFPAALNTHSDFELAACTAKTTQAK